MTRFFLTLGLVVLAALGLGGSATAGQSTPSAGTAVQSVAVPDLGPQTNAAAFAPSTAYNTGVWSLQMQDRVLRGFRVIPKGQTALQNGIRDVSWVRVGAGLCMRRQIKDPNTGFFSPWSNWMHGGSTGLNSFVGVGKVTAWAVVSC